LTGWKDAEFRKPLVVYATGDVTVPTVVTELVAGTFTLMPGLTEA
jgi:hypothetical protein